MNVKFWGVRGSIPSPGPDTVKYGGNTTCIEVEITEDYSVVFDAGSGIRQLGQHYLKNKIMCGKNVDMALFITHTHWDHIQGFPFFVPAFVPKSQIHIYGAPNVNMQLEDVLRGQQQYQYFPVQLKDMKSGLAFHQIEDGDKVQMDETYMYNVFVSCRKLNHPFPGVFAYRLDYEGKSFVLATDTEHYSTPDARLIDLAKDADVLVYDCQYTEDEYNQGRNLSWGHSTPDKGVEAARAANVKNMVMFHYDPNSTDEKIDKILLDAQTKYTDINIMAAYEGMEIDLDKI